MSEIDTARASGDLELDVVVEGDPAPLDDAQVVDLVGHTFATVEGQAHVGVHFVDEARMRELNREHRGVDAATDVLSFPVDGLDDLPVGVPRQLGDVFVCRSYVERQLADGEQMAPAGDTTLTQALRRCVVHGALHLLGELHDDDADAEHMFALEQRILDEVPA